MSVVDDALFLTIGRHDETHTEVKFTEDAHITVPVDDVIRAIISAYAGYQERARRRAEGKIK